MNDPTNWNPDPDTGMLTFASTDDAHKAAVLFKNVPICPETKEPCDKWECGSYAGCEEWAKRVKREEEIENALGQIVHG